MAARQGGMSDLELRTGIYEHITPTSLILPEGITYDQWYNTLQSLVTIHDGIKWYIGDCLNQGEHWWGEMYTQVMEIFEGRGWTYQHFANMKSVARYFPPEERSEKLAWPIYEAAIPLMRQDPEAAREILKRAEEEHLTKTEVAWDVRAARQELLKPEVRSAWEQSVHAAIANGHIGLSEPIMMMEPLVASDYQNGIEVDPEWAAELLEIVLALADADPQAYAMVDIHQRAVEWVMRHGLAYRWKG